MLQQAINAMMLGTTFVLVAVAFSLAIAVLNFVNFSIPGLFMLAAMLLWGVLDAGGSLWVAIPAALTVTVLASLAVELATYRWMQEADHLSPLVSSIAILILIENLVILIGGSDIQALSGLIGRGTLSIGGMNLGLYQLLGLGLAVCTVIGLSWGLTATAEGRRIRAIAENPTTARLLGIRVDRSVPVVFALTGLITGLAGILFALAYQQVHPFMGEEVAFKGISAMIVGGLGSIWGAVLGGFVVAVAEVAAITGLGSGYADLVVYGLLLLFLIVFPKGLLGGSAHGHEKF